MMSFRRCLTPLCVLLLFFLSPLMASETLSQEDAERLNEQKEIDSINQLSSPDGPEIESIKSASSELTGVMVDRTITMAGKTFYRAFSQRAMDNLIIGNATITIQERPDARWGSQIWVMDGNRMYFRTQLSPRINEADRAAGEAVKIVEEALLRQQIASALTPDKDLGREEIR
ncbi:Curli production assembly/transport component CsgE [Halomonas citrativorans]|uniref:Curli production assembly/transport component CsgE n=1 Tax=Halomonas citrativorans TaxID=2742612 RepID=A0A1R4HUT3_9GAMM|nr:CsgE family curli-type amyloid fiber assembly protein [Halomonas citrativorans]SJN11320.1 Curli production assembly/transport component CsgE [Halomonas citrativorans]